MKNRDLSERERSRIAKREPDLAPIYKQRAQAVEAAKKEEIRRSRHEMRRVRRWRRMYLEGDREGLKKDAGAVMGAVYAKVEEMVERINVDGLMVPQAKMISSERGGKRIVYELVPHPLLDPLFKAIKILHLDPVEFGMTPKALENGAPRGRVEIGKIDVTVVQGEIDAKTAAFMAALEKAGTLQANDPVYRDFVQLQSAVDAKAKVLESSSLLED